MTSRGQINCIARDAYLQGYREADESGVPVEDADIDRLFDASTASYEVGRLDLTPTPAEIVAALRALPTDRFRAILEELGGTP